MNPELETLDQLLGGDLPLKVIRGLYPDADHFQRAVLAMLQAGDLRLLDDQGNEQPRWNWTAALDQDGGKLSITDAGARRIA